MVSEEKKKHMMTLIKRYRSTAITHKKKQIDYGPMLK